MQRNDYDHIPNRIIPPHVSMINGPVRRPEYEQPRVGRPLFGDPPARLPLLGTAPDDHYGYQRPIPGYHANTYNGPIVANPNEYSRRRGFDKGPYGEDYGAVKNEGRQPLLKTPRLEVERIGGDMEISRSRSGSPERRIPNARHIKDDRKKDRQRARRASRSPSRTRSRSRDRNTRDRDRTRHREREKFSSVTNEPIRDGVLWSSDNFFEFLKFFIDQLNEEIESSFEIHGQRKLCENVTRANELEKQRIVLPPDFNNSDRERMLHCDTTIDGLPAAIFFGSGYGPRAHYAKYSAAKDLIDKCQRIGVISSDLYAAIVDMQRLDYTFRREYCSQIRKAVNSVILLIKRMAHETLPPNFMSLRNLDPLIIERFKMILRMVMIDVYQQEADPPPKMPEALKSYSGGSNGRERASYSTSSTGSGRHEIGRSGSSDRTSKDIDDRIPSRLTDKDALPMKEKEIKELMEKELAKKRLEMEQEIRQKILDEERAKIRAELEMEKKIEAMMAHQHQYQTEREREKRELEEQERKNMMLKKVEDDFNAMVEQLEKRFVEIRAKGLKNVLDMIYDSATFKTIQLYSTTLTSISFEQKQQLVVDLKSLLDGIAVATDESKNLPGLVNIGHNTSYPSTSGIAQSATASTSRDEGVRRLKVGDIRLRALSSAEQRNLTEGSKVIAQDMKTGNWNLASVMKVRDNRVTLTVGKNVWKKYLDELYIEDKDTYY